MSCLLWWLWLVIVQQADHEKLYILQYIPTKWRQILVMDSLHSAYIITTPVVMPPVYKCIVHIVCYCVVNNSVSTRTMHSPSSLRRTRHISPLSSPSPPIILHIFPSVLHCKTHLSYILNTRSHPITSLHINHFCTISWPFSVHCVTGYSYACLWHWSWTPLSPIYIATWPKRRRNASIVCIRFSHTNQASVTTPTFALNPVHPAVSSRVKHFVCAVTDRSLLYDVNAVEFAFQHSHCHINFFYITPFRYLPNRSTPLQYTTLIPQITNLIRPVSPFVSHSDCLFLLHYIPLPPHSIVFGPMCYCTILSHIHSIPHFSHPLGSTLTCSVV